MMTAPELAERLGLRRYTRSWRGECPACHYAGDTFSVRGGFDQRPRLYCANGCDRAALDDAVQNASGAAYKPAERLDDATLAESRRRRQEAAARLWASTEPLPGTPGETYLRSRGLAALASSDALRFRGDCKHPEGGRHPAMVAAIRDAGNQVVAVHRTYLRRDGAGKADVTPSKASKGTVAGGAIRLHREAAELVIAEGIETAGAAHVLTGLPAWAAISAGNLAGAVMLPAIVQSVVVVVDRDPAGERAAIDAGRRWTIEGRRVRYLMPDQAGADASDVLQAFGGCDA